ncbi:MAG TPA: 5'-nucleotidase C-terminal domain-containing protein, partial [Thermoanaerobaculia bacterium]
DGRYLQVSGLKFRYDAKGVRDVTVNGAPLDPAKTYSVASIDYLYKNGPDDGYTLFAEATRPPKINTEREADFRTSVEAYLRRAGTIETKVEGRIVRE